MSAADIAPPAGIDPDLWGTMSPEERAGIAGTDYSDGELATIKKLAAADGGSGDDDDDDEPAGGKIPPAPAEAGEGGKKAAPGDAGSATETPDASGKPADTPAAPAAATAASQEPGQAQAAPVYKAELPGDFDDRVKAVGAKETAAWEAFNSGDKTREELQAELSQINTERAELDRIKTKVEVSQEMTAQTAETQWKNAVMRLASEAVKPESGGIDYSKDKDKLADLDHFVKALAANEANEDKSMDWFLSEAHKRVRALHGLAEAPGKAPPLTPAQANAARKPDVTAAPATLANVPGSEGPGDVGSEFSDIDGLEGEDLEDAIAKMSPERRARFAAGR